MHGKNQRLMGESGNEDNSVDGDAKDLTNDRGDMLQGPPRRGRVLKEDPIGERGKIHHEGTDQTMVVGVSGGDGQAAHGHVDRRDRGLTKGPNSDRRGSKRGRREVDGSGRDTL